MSPAAPKLSLADQALANALGFLCAQVTEDGRTVPALALVARLLPQAAQDNPRMAAMCAAAAEVVRAARARNQTGGAVPFAQAMLSAHAAVADFLFWRASLAADAFYDAQPKGETHAAD